MALEYTFARAPLGVTAKRDVGHIYELGGGRLLNALVGVTIRPETLAGLAVAISLDLSSPHKVLDSMLFWIQAVKDNVRRVFRELESTNSRAAAKLKSKTERIWKGHEDAG